MTSEMTAERLADIRQRASAATKGPWVAHHGYSTKPVSWMWDYDDGAWGVRSLTVDETYFHTYCEDCIGGVDKADAEFIAHARQDVPALLDEVDRLRGRNIDLAIRLDLAVHELEEHVAPERDRLREQVKTLQAELEICRGERFGTDPAAWGQSMNEAWKRLGLPVSEEGTTP